MLSCNNIVTNVTLDLDLQVQAVTVIALLNEAAETIRRSRLNGGLPSARLASWPDVVRSINEAYGYHRVRFRPPAPTPEQIDRLDRVLGWLLMLSGREASIFGARLSGLRWAAIEAREGLSERHARRLLWSAAMFISSLDKTIAGMSGNMV